MVGNKHAGIANTEEAEMAVEGLGIEIAIGESGSAKCRKRIARREVS